ncbi:DDE-type integrase/transposase/recombinase [Streptacidiphilus sp. EB129]|uniref:DDE-type integrase/transposase/recombinase n=1 Tax=Streptacidiphilus sp. EB129 TaxID=3156262 RepID=UPI003515E5FA
MSSGGNGTPYWASRPTTPKPRSPRFGSSGPRPPGGPARCGEARRTVRAGPDKPTLAEWRLGEALIKINSELNYLWRSVDAGGNVLSILVRTCCDRAAVASAASCGLSVSSYGCPAGSGARPCPCVGPGAGCARGPGGCCAGPRLGRGGRR